MWDTLPSIAPIAPQNGELIIVELHNSFSFPKIQALLSSIKTLGVAHLETDHLHLKIMLSSKYPQDFFHAGAMIADYLTVREITFKED